MDVCFILVAPAVPENVGAAARALKTMGFNALRIVASDAHRQPPARYLAHGAGDILDAARAYPDLAAALADCDLSIATSAKARHQIRRHYGADELLPLVRDKAGAVQRVAMVFGREDSGLRNDEIALCDAVSSIPLVQPYPSLNLGQAVMLYAYQLAPLRQGVSVDDSEQSAAAASYRHLRAALVPLLQRLGYGPDSKLHQWALQRLPQADAKDIGFLQHLIRAVNTGGRADRGE